MVLSYYVVHFTIIIIYINFEIATNKKITIKTTEYQSIQLTFYKLNIYYNYSCNMYYNYKPLLTEAYFYHVFNSFSVQLYLETEF
jgi:hypothetical protein